MTRVLRPGGRLMVVYGYRDLPWGWFIFDVCVASVEGDVHHASARRIREMMTEAGLHAIAQRRFPGLAPFLMSEGVAAEPVPWSPVRISGRKVPSRAAVHASNSRLADRPTFYQNTPSCMRRTGFGCPNRSGMHQDRFKRWAIDYLPPLRLESNS